MGNASIDHELMEEIKELLKEKEFRIKYQSLKGFIDKSCKKELERIGNHKHLSPVGAKIL